MPVARIVSRIACGAAQARDGAVERGKEPVTGGVDLGPVESRELAADDSVVIGEHLLPCLVADAAGGARRVDDIGHDERGDDPLVLTPQADLVDVARNVEDDSRLVADHPGIVSGRDIGHIVRDQLDLLAIVHPHGEAAGEEDLEVVHGARHRPHLRADVRGPPPARLQDAATDGEQADMGQRYDAQRERPQLVRMVEVPLRNGAHRGHCAQGAQSRSSRTCRRSPYPGSGSAPRMMSRPASNSSA